MFVFQFLCGSSCPVLCLTEGCQDRAPWHRPRPGRCSDGWWPQNPPCLHSPGVAMCRGEQLVMRWHMGHQIIITRMSSLTLFILSTSECDNSSLKADQAFKSIWIKEKISSIALSRCFIGQVWRYSAECVPLFSLHLLLFTFRLRNVMNVNMLIPRQAPTAQWQDTPRPRNVR